MKKTTPFKLLSLTSLLLISLFTVNLFATEPLKTNDPALKDKAQQFVTQSKQLGFEENKGQFKDTEGDIASYVLFKTSVPNLNMWITTTGITYQFLKFDEEKKSDLIGERRGGKALVDDVKTSSWHRVDMIIKDAEIKKENVIVEGDITEGEINYYLGHCPNGVRNVKIYNKITIKNIYEGIDWVLYTDNNFNGSFLKQDFIVHPNADPNQIKLIYEGSGIFEALNNQLSFENQLGKIAEGTLLCYQGNQSTVIPSKYIVNKNNSLLHLGAGNIANEKSMNQTAMNTEKVFSYEVSIQTNDYNKNENLIIDPQLFWSTFFGGTNDYEACMAMDCDPRTGDLIVTGYVGSTDFPVVNLVGAYYQPLYAGSRDIFISRFSGTGVPLWVTYFGGSNTEHPYALCIDNSSNILITGKTSSANFPLQNPGGGAYFQATNNSNSQDVFILKFNSSGVRMWCTYYGGNTADAGYGIATDQSDNIFVVGEAGSASFPVFNPGGGAYTQAFGSAGAFNEGFIAKFSSTGVRLWVSFYGGIGDDIPYAVASDATGNVFMTGYTSSLGSTPFPVLNPGGGAFYDATMSGNADGFIVKFNNAGVRQWATLFGGTSSIDVGYSIKCDYNSDVIVTGETASLVSFPLLNPGNGAYYQPTNGAPLGSIDAFILKFDNNGVQKWGTFYGGSGQENFNTFDNIVIDTCNSIFISFNTVSPDVPTKNTPNCALAFFDGTHNGADDIFIAKFNEAGVHAWGTYLGGDGSDWREAMAIDPSSNIYIGGEWTEQGGVTLNSATYSLANPGGGAYYDPIFDVGTSDDAYIVKFKNLEPSLTPSSANSGGCNGCNGTATVTINCGDPTFTYIWSNGAQTLNSTSNTNTITGLCPGSYTVTVTSGCDKVLTQTFTIGGTFGITPTVTTSSTLTINCTNPTGTISANATPVSSTYSWAGPGIVSGGNTASPIVNAGGTYTVTVNYLGCTATATVTVINDNAPPVVTTAGSVFEINCMYASDSISVIATPSGVTYVWTGPGIVSGGTTSNPVVNAPGTYTVVVTNPNNGCTSTATVSVTQNTITPNLTAGNPLILTCVVTSATISASSTTVPVNYSWSGPGIVSGGTTSSPIVNLPGTYTVTVTNPQNFCTNTATVLVTQDIATPNVTAGPGFMLTCTAPSGTISSSSTTSGVTFSWTGPNVVSGATTPVATVNAQGTYTITVTNPVNGCTNTATVLVTSDNSIPNLTAGPPFTLNCLILSGTINASSTTLNATFSWSGPGITSGGTTSAPTINAPGTYVVTVTDPLTGCTAVSSVLVINDNAPPTVTATATTTMTCVNTSDTITVTSSTLGVTYVWTGTGIVSGGTSTSPIVNAPGTYTVTITDPSNGCTSTATVTVGLNITAPNAVAGSPITLTCVNTSNTISATSSTPGATYNWSGSGIVSGGTTSTPTVNTPGTYTVTITDPVNGCTSTTSVVVNQNIITPNVTAGATLTLTCTTTSSTISASSTTPGASFVWTGPSIVSGDSTATPTVNGVGTYTVVVTDPINGCTSTTTVTVNDNINPPNVTAGSPLTLHCNLTSSTISASSTTANASYSWAGPGIVSGGTTATPTVNQAGTYTVTVTDPVNGCTSTSTVTVVYAPLPSAYVSASVTIILGSSTLLSAGGGGTYSWSPTNGLSCTTCSDPIATPVDTTIYCVTVTDQYGCSDSACVQINVVDPCPPTNDDFPVPNVFTPNDDDKNDLFYLKDWNSECIVEFSIAIYDRWGLKMFESNGSNVFWDGRTSSGLVSPAGTYYYILKVRRLRGELKTYKGFLMLAR